MVNSKTVYSIFNFEGGSGILKVTELFLNCTYIEL